ncbi:MAG: polymerase III, subunit gamma and tau protein [Candidatus Roizmanbacteria bacterium GW2011_GWC2_37_13]|uniref:DNA polymerase III subunit gamma/tau n=1 Tax=Candidatus Roizmanbacteria bacterium GW2011_GWC2_37_13 TaxID=1618486 RepID=A0A0G0J7W9_9BACT|nr:MAG: polymerase III, subunit gamma and tau protein [Candidatus Roizmanbacteria bacterium GW2011_GWC1_37_12]KKQ24166.1 MAG: polymerase III, subunit gamma and tau protein [Candidatus Roizmanbacteria bacterium GW2011_GWC2_37_13]
MFYLKYRPKTISELDNTRVRDQLRKILESKDFPHAFLFVGQKGTGKTSAARIFAKAINCLKRESIEPCNRCVNCLAIASSSFTDVIEMDAASNRGIEEVKNLIRETSFLPMSGKYRVFIIDEAHMITADGFNALLKTLEEPSPSAIFILATTNLEKLPKTIQSRCVKVNFGKGLKTDIISMLKRIDSHEKVNYQNDFYSLIAKHSDNSFRDAAKILEEVSMQRIKTVAELETFLGIRGKSNLLEIIESKDNKKTFIWIEEFAQNAGNFKNLIEDVLEELRIQLLIKKGVIIEDEKITTLTLSEISRLIKLLMEAYQLLRSSPIESLPLEIALTEFYNQLEIRN